MPVGMSALMATMTTAPTPAIADNDNVRRMALQLVEHTTRPLGLLEAADAVDIFNCLDAGFDLKYSIETLRAVCTAPLELADALASSCPMALSAAIAALSCRAPGALRNEL